MQFISNKNFSIKWKLNAFISLLLNNKNTKMIFFLTLVKNCIISSMKKVISLIFFFYYAFGVFSMHRTTNIFVVYFSLYIFFPCFRLRWTTNIFALYFRYIFFLFSYTLVEMFSMFIKKCSHVIKKNIQVRKQKMLYKDIFYQWLLYEESRYNRYMKKVH